MAQRPMVSKTRERLVEVARQLFARKGVENTTMAEIADACDKGRRTIYTYFRNKREIHQAVVESESEQIVSRQRQIQHQPISNAEKIDRMIRARLEILKCPTDSLEGKRGEINLGFRFRIEGTRAGKARRLAALKELDIFRSILAEGVKAGEFDSVLAERVQSVMLVLALGVDNPQASQYLTLVGADMERVYNDVISFMIESIQGRTSQTTTTENNN